MSKRRLIKRLSWYYPTELFNVFLFTGIMIWLLINFPFLEILSLLYGLLIMTVILFQGQYYWRVKLKNLQGKSINQDVTLAYFRISKKFNLVLIALIPFALFIELYLNSWVISNSILYGWAIFANIFGILEYINYYHYQLMYDNVHDLKYLQINKKLKIASLKKDLIENKI